MVRRFVVGVRGGCRSAVMRVGSILLLAGFGPVPMPAMSAEGGGQPTTDQAATAKESPVLADIVITAQRRSENLERVGLSVTAFSAEQLQDLGMTNATDITKLAPAVSIYQIHPSVTSINIRGVSQNYFADHLEAPIAVYQDDAYLGSTSSVGVRSFDLQRVEVLRGPQGTLFGRNATGGLIHYISKGPTDHLDAYAQVTSGGYEYGNGFAQTEAAVGGPLSDSVRARLSVATNNDAGPWHNALGPNPGNINEYAARLQFEFDLAEKTKLNLIGTADLNRSSRGAAYTTEAAGVGTHQLGYPLGPHDIGTYVNLAALPALAFIDSPCPGCDLTGYRQGPNPFKVNLSNPGDFNRSIYSATAKLTHQFDGAELTTVSNYQHIDKRFALDSDGGPSFLFDYGTRMAYRQYSQELRLAGDADRLKWVTGAFYLNMRGQYGVDGLFDLGPYIGLTCTRPACTGGSPVQDAFRADYKLSTQSWSVFAQSDYFLTPEFYATTGLRFTDDHKVFDYAWHDTLGFQSVLTGGPATVAYNPGTDPSADRKFDNVSAKAQLNWAPNSDDLYYLGYTRGHKGGNWSAPIFPPIDVASLPHKQEVLSSFEIGAKLRILDGHATLNAATFYYDYKDYQAFAIVNLVQKIFNVDATAYGGEVEFRVNPAAGLDFALSGAFMQSRVKHVPLPDNTLADRKLPNSPGASLDGLARYSFNALGGLVGAQVSANFFGSHYLTALNEPTNYETAHTTADLRVDYSSPGEHWTVAAFVHNVTNVYYRVWGLDVSALSYEASIYAPPRTYGMTIGWKY
jgi:iron complex outermembrane receptor protein